MLEGKRILAWGARSAVELCAGLLQRAGATIDTADSRTIPAAGFLTYDAIIVSSDLSSAVHRSAITALKAGGSTIVCDITATGPQSSRTGAHWSDGQMQAITGLMDTTGFAAGKPVKIGVPFTEISAAMYAAASVAAAIHVSDARGMKQNIDVTLFGCAAGALTTFLPNAFARGTVGRVGNRHPACAPWNAYQTRDGWILICTSTEDQWRKLKGIAGSPVLEEDRFASLASRVLHVDALDVQIAAWTNTLTTQACTALCEQAGVAAGPILSISDLAVEPNFLLRHPHAAERLRSAGIERDTYADIPAFRSSPLACGDQTKAADTIATREQLLPEDAGPLAGITVVEIGQYTTAPLVGKHLAALGAEVIKVEPPHGEAARAWMPGQRGTSYFFALNNTDKRTLSLDLKQDADRDHLRALLKTADVLVENLRPGSLSKLGFDRSALAAINPRLVYCSISGFGVESAYPTRPAFDTVIQAMGGMMDLTRAAGVPVKVGASGADILGGQAALFAIVATLADKTRRHAGTFVEISMQDVAAWCSLFSAGNPEPEGVALACADGYVWAESADPHDLKPLEIRCRLLTRQRAIAELQTVGVRAVPVARVHELMEDGDFLADVLTVGRGPDGGFWPVLKVPYRLSRTPAKVRVVPGAPESLRPNPASEAKPAIDSAISLKSAAALASDHSLGF
jgi:crotonobetainyl-CoA:carnitine CoA-transferase CaiB-like acyl-CoA transferase